jgi:hypothetical protein
MRCARCDGLAIPQAVGLSADEHVVFGWCLRCLEETGCRTIQVAQPSRRPSTRLDLRERVSRRRRERFRIGNKARARSDPLEERRRLLALVALPMVLWGLFISSIGVAARWLWPGKTAFGNGTSALLAGAATALCGLVIWALVFGVPRLGQPVVLKGISVGAFLFALSVLALGVVFYTRRREPLFVAAASSLLAVSVAARWIEVRKVSPEVHREMSKN